MSAGLMVTKENSFHRRTAMPTRSTPQTSATIHEGRGPRTRTRTLSVPQRKKVWRRKSRLTQGAKGRRRPVGGWVSRSLSPPRRRRRKSSCRRGRGFGTGRSRSTGSPGYRRICTAGGRTGAGSGVPKLGPMGNPGLRVRMRKPASATASHRLLSNAADEVSRYREDRRLFLGLLLGLLGRPSEERACCECQSSCRVLGYSG